MIIKRLLLIAILSSTLSLLIAQTSEYGFSLNSGLFSYYGDTPGTSSIIEINESFNTVYTINPYGTKSGLSIGLSAFFQDISENGFIWGFEGGYDLLKSKINIDKVHEVGFVVNEYDAKGETQLESQFLKLFPYLGYRMNLGKMNVDVNLGIEMGYCLKMMEKGEATDFRDWEYTTLVDRRTINFDYGPRVQVDLWYNDVGLHVGYSIGLANYLAEQDGANMSAYSNYMRFGLKTKL